MHCKMVNQATVSAETAKSEASTSKDSIWAPEIDLMLFLSMVGLRPIGIHRHFRMLNIYMRFISRLGDIDITSMDIWKRLEQLYDLDLLNELDDDDDDNDEDNDEDSDEGKDTGNEKSENTTTNTKRQSNKARKIKSEKEDHEEEEERAIDESGDKATSEDSGNEEEEEGDDDKDSKSENSSDEGNGGSDEVADRGKPLHLPISVTSVVPQSSIGTTIDMTDPQFWRKSDVEFSLPWTDFGTLMLERAGADVPEDADDLGSIADALSTASASKHPTPEPDGSADELAQPMPKRRKGRSGTPVQRSRGKATSTPTHTSTRSLVGSTRSKRHRGR